MIRDRDKSRDQRSEDKEEFADRVAVETAQKAASRMATDRVAERKDNPNFLRKLQQPGVDSDEFDWVEDEFGPVFADAHFIGNRSEQYERIARWGNFALAERMIEEGNPGRLCTGTLRRLAHGVDPDPREADGDPPRDYNVDERRAIRETASAATNYQTNAIGSKGLESVTTATTVARTEKHEEETTWRDKAARALD